MLGMMQAQGAGEEDMDVEQIDIRALERVSPRTSLMAPEQVLRSPTPCEGHGRKNAFIVLEDQPEHAVISELCIYWPRCAACRLPHAAKWQSLQLLCAPVA